VNFNKVATSNVKAQFSRADGGQSKNCAAEGYEYFMGTGAKPYLTPTGPKGCFFSARLWLSTNRARLSQCLRPCSITTKANFRD
jgi:hypothetical protein